MRNPLKSGGILPYVIILVLFGAASYLLVFSPKLAEIGKLRAEVAARETEMGSAIRVWGQMAQTPGQQTHRWEEQVREWREKVPVSPETDLLLGEIGRLAVVHKLRAFRLIVPAEGSAGKPLVAEGPGPVPEGQEPDKAAGFGELRLQITFLSTYREMAEFLEGIQKTKRLLSVKKFALREKEGDMETMLELSAWYRER